MFYFDWLSKLWNTYAKYFSTLLCIYMEPVNQRKINMHYRNEIWNIYSIACFETQRMLTRLNIQVLMLEKKTLRLMYRLQWLTNAIFIICLTIIRWRIFKGVLSERHSAKFQRNMTYTYTECYCFCQNAAMLSNVDKLRPVLKIKIVWLKLWFNFCKKDNGIGVSKQIINTSKKKKVWRRVFLKPGVLHWNYKNIG